MAFDNYTPTAVRALRECPQGQRPGQVFIVTADEAEALVLVGDVEIVQDDPPKDKRGPYKRRDQRAED